MVDSLLAGVDCGGMADEGGVVIGGALARILMKVSI